MIFFCDSVPDCMLDFGSSCSTVHRCMLALDFAIWTLWKRFKARLRFRRKPASLVPVLDGEVVCVVSQS